MVFVYWMFIGLGPLVGVGRSGTTGLYAVFQEPKEESHICKPFTAQHTEPGAGIARPGKGTYRDLVMSPTVSISTGLGHFMSLTIAEGKNDSLVSIKTRGLSTIKLFKFIMSSLSSFNSMNVHLLWGSKSQSRKSKSIGCRQ